MWLLRDYESSTLPKSFDSTVRSQSTHLEEKWKFGQKIGEGYRCQVLYFTTTI